MSSSKVPDVINWINSEGDIKGANFKVLNGLFFKDINLSFWNDPKLPFRLNPLLGNGSYADVPELSIDFNSI